MILQSNTVIEGEGISQYRISGPPPPPPFIFVPLSPSLAATLGPLAFSSRSARPLAYSSRCARPPSLKA